MIPFLFNRALKMGLVTFTVSSFAIAQDTKESEAGAEPPMDTKSDSSYAMGYRAGGEFLQQFGRFGITLDDIEMERFMAGFKAAAKAEQSELSGERLQAVMQVFGEELQKREIALAKENLETGRSFLKENAKREGVVTLDSGLQYEVLKKGGEETYQAPAEGETSNKLFMVNYTGRLIDGTEFDASPEGAPESMELRVIEGLREALTTMPVGAKWKLFIPSELAYGEKRASPKIGPNTVLVFELELLEIKDAPPQQQGSFPIPTQ